MKSTTRNNIYNTYNTNEADNITLYDIITYITKHADLINGKNNGKTSSLIKGGSHKGARKDNLSDDLSEDLPDDLSEDLSEGMTNNTSVKNKIKIEPLVMGKRRPLDILPDNLTAIFGKVNSLERVGVMKNVEIPANTNITLVASILTLIDNDFINMKEKEKKEFIEAFVSKIHKDSRNKFNEFDYKTYGWKLREFSKNVNTFTIGKDLIKYIADYVCVNIFILDICSDTLVFVGDDRYIKYKKNIFLMKYDSSTFEPVIPKSHDPTIKYMSYDSNIIRKLINSPLLVEKLHYDFRLEKNLDKILGNDDDSDNTEDDGFVVGVENLMNYIVKNKIIIEDTNVIDDHIKDTGNNKNNDKNNDKNNEHEDINVFEDVPKTHNVDIVNDIIANISESREGSDESDTEDSDTEDTDTEKSDYEKLELSELKEMAKKHKIQLTYIKNDKRATKSRQMLIDELKRI